jgi:predicted AAA+ superfamily ATPase
MIDRFLETIITKRLGSDKAIVILGPRQVGKTTLLQTILSHRNDVLWLNGDERDTQSLFNPFDKHRILENMHECKYLVIDEAQRIEDIGLKLKILNDSYRTDFQVIATGSSSFDLASKLNEPLTGRKWEFRMFPLTFSEMVLHHGLDNERARLATRLTYGYYPAVVTHPNDEADILAELANSNLYKDVLKWANIKKSDKLITLLQALAYQIGSQVSVNELSQLVGLDNKTVEKYLMLLEQAFVIFHLGSFSRNLRNELKSSHKFYFYDVGIRNALIDNFSDPERRTDIGSLFENFVIAELTKRNNRLLLGNAGFFWRTTAQQEVDYVREENGRMTAYEIKWNPKARAHVPKTFMQAYEPEHTKILHRDNFFEELR